MAAAMDELLSIILSWSIDNITSPTFFQFQIGTVPVSFSSVGEYQQSFRFPLLEEIRAQFHQDLGKTFKSNSKIIPMKIMKIHKLRQGKVRSTIQMLLTIHLYGSVSQWSTLECGGFILLCSKVPKWDSQRECIVDAQDDEYILAFIKRRRIPQHVQALICLGDGHNALHKIPNSDVFWYAASLSLSLIPSERIWKSLDDVKSAKSNTGLPVLQSILNIKEQPLPNGTSSLRLCQAPKQEALLKYVEAYCNIRSLNSSQRDALRSAVAGLLSKNVKPHVRLVQGPPGTGKTAMLGNLLSVLGGLHRRTLISAPTNAAVLEVSKRLMSSFQNSGDDKMHHSLTFSEFCSDNPKLQGSSISKDCWRLDLSEVVVVGSIPRMQEAVNGTLLQDVFLPYRVLRLKDSLKPITGWKDSLQSVVHFMNNARDQFKARRPKGITKDRKLKSKEATGGRSASNDDIKESSTDFPANLQSTKKDHNHLADNSQFWIFALEYMKQKQHQMRRSSYILTRELPRCHLDLQTSKAMTAVSLLMDTLVDAMPLVPPLDAASWFTTLDSTLSEEFAQMNMCGDAGRNEDNVRKLQFLHAKEALLRASKSRPGCTLFKTKKKLQGFVPGAGWLRSECLKNATLVFSTVSSAGSPLMEKVMGEATFECAIIDEASQLVEAETTIVTKMEGLKQLILVGDHKQLPATVISKVAQNCGYGRSLFDRLQSLQHGCRHLLNVQYRMNPAISRFSNFQFYDGQVKDGLNVLSAEYGKEIYECLEYDAYVFLDCKGGVEIADNKSWKNPKEVGVVMGLINLVLKEMKSKKVSIGVIAPYRAQVEAVKKSLSHLNLNTEADVEVRTVDGFQGNEKDIIIFTAVRANNGMKVGFVDDHCRLNVAITRGRYFVWIVGNAETLAGGGKIWNMLIDDAKARHCFHSSKFPVKKAVAFS